MTNSTTFIPFTTKIPSGWANDVNSTVYGYRASVINGAAYISPTNTALQNSNGWIAMMSDAATATAGSAYAAGCKIIIPYGQIPFNGSIANAPNIWLDGAGKNTTSFIFNTVSNGLSLSSPINSSTAVNTRIEGINFININPSNSGGGYVDVGGTFVDLFNCGFYGWAYNVIFDQTEIATIDLCNFEQSTNNSASLWLVNGPDHTSGANFGYTNTITITRNQFNGDSNGRNILDDGGGTHIIKNNNFNGGTSLGRFAGVTTLIIEGNDSEVHTVTDIELYDTTLSSTYVGPCKAPKIEGNLLQSDGVTNNVIIQNVSGGSLSYNVVGQAVGAAFGFINGSSNKATGLTIRGNDKLIAGAGITAAPFVSGFSRSFTMNLIEQVPVTYSSSALASTGSQTITPESMEFIHVGSRLNCVSPDGTNSEDIIVISTTVSTFTATFASTKAALFQIRGATPYSQQEGSWTPTLGATNVSGNHTYSVQTGQWSRRGNLINFTGEIVITSVDNTINGQLLINGLPFTAEAVNYTCNVTAYSGITLTSGYSLIGLFVPNNNATPAFVQSGSGQSLAALNATSLGTSMTVYFSGSMNTSSL